MLELNDSKWEELSHAYGNAADIPKLLKQLENAPPSKGYEDEPYFSLWSSLCHQYDVYSASYAAVPYIVEMTIGKDKKKQFDHLLLVSTIEACRHRNEMPSIPIDLQDSYFSSLQKAEKLTVELLKLDWEEDFLRCLLGGLATLKGYYKFGFAISEFQEEIECPHCEENFILGSYELFD